MVFPGGALDPADHNSEWSSLLNKPETKELAFQVAAIREAFEECGLHVFKPDLKLPADEIAKWRKAVHDNGSKLLEMAKATGYMPDLARLGLYSNVSESHGSANPVFLSFFSLKSVAHDLLLLNGTPPTRIVDHTRH